MSIDRFDKIGGVWDEEGNPRPGSWNRNPIDPMPGFSKDPSDYLPEMYPWTFDEGRLESWVFGCCLAILTAVSAVIYIVVNLYLRYVKGVRH